MKALIDKLGGALTTIFVTALLALVAMIVKHDSEMMLMKYRLEQVEQKLKDHNKHRVNKNE